MPAPISIPERSVDSSTPSGSPLLGIITGVTVRRCKTPSFYAHASASVTRITPMNYSLSGYASPMIEMQHTGKQLPARGGRSRHDEDPSSPSVSWMSHTFESIPKSPLRKQMSFVTFPEAHPPTALVQADNQPFPMFPSAEGEESITNVAWADVVPEQSHGSLFVSGLVPTTFGHGSPVPIYTIMPDSVIVHSKEGVKNLLKDKTTGFHEPASPSDDSCASPPVTSKTAPQSVTSPTFSVSDNNALSDSAAAAASNSPKKAASLRCKALFLDESPLGQEVGSQAESASNSQPANAVIASPHSPFVTPLASSLSANRPSLSIQPLSLNQSQSDDCASSINIADHRRKLQVRRTTDVPNQVVSLGASTILSASQNNTPPTTKEAPQATVPESAAPQPQKNAKPARPPITLREARPSDAEGIIALRDSLDMTNATSFVWDLEDMRKRIETRYPLIIIALTPDPSSNGASEVVVGVAGIDVHGMEKDFPVRSIGSRLLGVPANTDYVFPADYCMCRGLLIHQQYQGFGLGSMLNKGRLRLLASIAPNAKVILSARGCTIEETLSVVVPCMESQLDHDGSNVTPEFTKDELFEFTFSTSVGIVHMVHGKDREGWKFVAVDIADGGPVWLTSKPLSEIVSSYDVNVEVGYALHRHTDPNSTS